MQSLGRASMPPCRARTAPKRFAAAGARPGRCQQHPDLGKQQTGASGTGYAPPAKQNATAHLNGAGQCCAPGPRCCTPQREPSSRRKRCGAPPSNAAALPLVPGAGGGSSRAGSPLQDAAVGRFAWTSRLWVQPAGSRAVGRKRRKARRSAPAVPCLFNHEEREERRWLCTVHPVYPARNSSSGPTTGCAGREDAHGHGTSIVPKSCLRWRPGEQSLASFPLKRPIRALYPHQRACFQLVSLAIMLKSHEKHSEQ